MLIRLLYSTLLIAAMAFPAYAAPVVGVSGVSANSDAVRAMMTLLSAKGATPVFLGNHAHRDPNADIEKIDALVVMGNSYDIDPARYGEKKHPKTKSETDTPEGRARAAYEYAIMEKALAKKMPLLGICGGEQRLNVLRGGTLHQHVPDLVGHEENAQFLYNIPPFVPVQPIHIAPDTRLAYIAGEYNVQYAPEHDADINIMENSMHHQAVDRLGEGLRAVAFSDEYESNGEKKRLIEAVEPDPDGPLKSQFVLGVQWHPEFGASPLGGKIVDAVIKAADRFAVAHPHTLDAKQVIEENTLSALPEMRLPKDGVSPRPGSETAHIRSEILSAPPTAR